MNRVRLAVILSAGHGTRLAGLTARTPKVMLPVNGRPLLEHHVARLADAGVEEVCLNLHAHPEVIRSHFGDGSGVGVRLHYSVEPALLGTAGSLNGFRNVLRDRFFVQYGDVYSELDIAAFDRFHLSAGAAATLVVHPSSHPEDSDIVEVNSDAEVTAVHHKPGSARYGNLGNAGCYMIEPGALGFLAGEGPSDFIQDLFPAMLAAGRRLMAYHTDDLLMDMGTPQRYRALLDKVEAR